MSLHKANRFIRKAIANGWETKYHILSKQDENIRVTATRGPEKIVIEWQSNQLAFSPEYHIHEVQLKIHSRLDAERKLENLKPDMEQYQRLQRKAQLKARREAAPVGPLGISEQPLDGNLGNIEANLPFDIEEDSDSTILKAIRGSTILFRNSISGATESVFVPWRFKGKNGEVQIYNHDTENVFYLSESEEGRAWLSFMDMNGCFRAVHLDRLIGVV